MSSPLQAGGAAAAASSSMCTLVVMPNPNPNWSLHFGHGGQRRLVLPNDLHGHIDFVELASAVPNKETRRGDEPKTNEATTREEERRRNIQATRC